LTSSNYGGYRQRGTTKNVDSPKNPLDMWKRANESDSDGYDHI